VGAGIVVRSAGRQRLSQHFSGHLSGVFDPLLGFVTDLIDGNPARLVGQVEVLPLESNGVYARVAIVDTGETRAFVVALRVIDDAERASIGGSSWDTRGTPRLLADFHDGSRWDLYNCQIIDFQVWPRELIYEGKLPAR
jgi:hypothetical protein